MTAKISSSQTKVEILKAYEQLLGELKEEQNQNTALKKELEKRNENIANVHQKIESEGTTSIAQLRNTFNEQLDALENKLEEEQQHFLKLQEGIKFEKQLLEELHNIKAEAESLQALVSAHKAAKEKLDQEIVDQKAEHEQNIKQKRLQWEREKEAYEYDLKIKRRNEQDAYNLQKEKLEKELKDKQEAFDLAISEREKAVAAQEEELQGLRKQVAEYEVSLPKKIEEVKKEQAQVLKTKYEFERQLELKDLQADIKLKEQQINSLNHKIEEQIKLIDTLTSRADGANAQVKDIALKAIENSGVKAFTLPGEKKQEKD